MTSDLRFDFVANKAARTLTIAREFAGPRQLVWDCYTKSELLDQWFAPKPLTTRTKHMDFRPGGYWHFAMIMPDGQEYWSRQDYQSIDPINGYTALDGFSDETGQVNPDLPRSTLQVTFTGFPELPTEQATVSPLGATVSLVLFVVPAADELPAASVATAL